jgi:rod shape-determining protein MreC
LSLIGLVLPSRDRDPIASALRRTLVAPLVSLQKGAQRWRAAWLADEQRQLAADSVSMRAVKTEALTVENDQLRKILGLGSRLQWGYVPAEALHSAVPTEDIVTTLTLAAGSTAGIQQYSPVVSDDGLVGTIYRADPTMSIVILYTNPDFRASAMTADGLTFGIIHPHAARGTGADAYMLELRGVPTRTTLKPGTMIYTSGLGGTFPRGITIGTVVSPLQTNEEWTRTYLVRPAVTPSRLTTVVVLTAQRVTQGTGNIWGGAVNTDSAAKRIAAAADSVSRAAAIADAKARQTTLDSLKTATIDSVRRSLGAPVLPPSAAQQPPTPAIPTPTTTSPRPSPPTGAPSSAKPAASSPELPGAPALIGLPNRSGAGTTARPPARRDSLRRDTLRRDTLRRDTLRLDSLRPRHP